MRVLMLSDAAPGARFGAEVHLAHLIDGLKAVGDETEVLAGVDRQGLKKTLDVWDPFVRARVREIERSFRPDVVHFHNVIRELSSSVFSAPKHSPRVLTMHDFRLLGAPDGPLGDPFDKQPIRAIKLLKARVERIIAKRNVDAVIAPNETVANWIRDRGFHEVHLVPYFMPPGPPATQPPSASSTVLFAGRLSNDKGLQILIPAFAQVMDRFPEAILAVAGDGPDRKRMEDMARSMLGDRVRLLGRLSNDELRAEMARARIVTLPTLMMETGPLVPIEGAFAGRPFIGSDAPGLNELPGVRTFGYIVPRGEPAPLADAIAALLEDPAKSDEFGAQARRHAMDTWTTEVGVKRVKAVYERAIEIARSGATTKT